MNFMYTPRVLKCMHFKYEEKSRPPARIVMDYEFDFCAGCDREMWLDDVCYQIEKGCFVIRKPGQKVSSKGYYDCYMLTLDFSDREPFSNYSRNTATQIQSPFESEIWEVLPSVFQPSHFEDYVRIFENFLSTNDIDPNENSKTLPLVNELLHLVISDAFSQHYSPEKEKSSINEVCAYIKRNYMKKITLDDLSAIAHLNKNYLVRQFKRTFGTSPISYLINIRMEYAKKLLVESNLPVKTIAIKCGYSDPGFFNSYFKKLFSVSPAAYRRTQQSNI